MNCKKCESYYTPADSGVCAGCQQLWSADETGKPFFVPAKSETGPVTNPALIYVETVEALIAETRLLDGAVEWLACCDELLDRLLDRVRDEDL